jgi:hypothetical protein
MNIWELRHASDPEQPLLLVVTTMEAQPTLICSIIAE